MIVRATQMNQNIAFNHVCHQNFMPFEGIENESDVIFDKVCPIIEFELKINIYLLVKFKVFCLQSTLNIWIDNVPNEFAGRS
jgi:hypothetical protein